MKSNRIAAFAVAVIDSGRVVHLSADGYRDLKNGLKATIVTPFHIASVSKTVTNLAVFKLVESGKLDLNKNINEYLPFVVKNPFYPKEIITVRDLPNHRSGIRDDMEIYGPLWEIPNGDPKEELIDFLRDYLTLNGKLYKKEHFESSSEYKSFSYSNTGVVLLGLIVEHTSGKPYEEFCQQNIFKPMRMLNTSRFLKNLDSNLVAKAYVYQDSLGLVFSGHNGYPDYPAGQLRTSISDFSNLIVGYLNSENNKFILDKTTISKITPNPKISQEGYYTWFLSAIKNHRYYTHNGGDTGVRTIVILDPVEKRAIVIFANTEYNNTTLYNSIEMEMWRK
ncbi:MAG: serine hydrolase domain-containing protein [Saprospiraceae bacterium]